jgi:hypothetical protein
VPGDAGFRRGADGADRESAQPTAGPLPRAEQLGRSENMRAVLIFLAAVLVICAAA